MIPVIIQLGPLPVYSFGLMLVLGILAGGWRLTMDVTAAGYDAEVAERVVFWGAMGGLIGARLFFVFSYPSEFLEDPFGMLFASSGFVYYGSLVVGCAAVFIVLRREKIPFLKFADLCVVALSIGYAVGRIGCHLSGDGDYGAISNLPWAVSYAQGVVPTPVGILVHPTPVYESIVALLIAFYLDATRRRKNLLSSEDGKKWADGRIFGVYLVLTSLARFGVEYIRIEPRVAFGLTQAQIISAALVVLGAWLFANRVQQSQ